MQLVSDRKHLAFGAGAIAIACMVALASVRPAVAGPYVTQTSGIRWNDVGGIRWNDVGGIRWNDVGGIRWNDVGGIRWNDVGNVLSTDASRIHWSDTTGLRYTDAGFLTFGGVAGLGGASVDLTLLSQFATIPDGSEVNVIVTYRARPTTADLNDLAARGVLGGTLMRRLPMVVVSATKDQIRQIALLPNVRSVFSNATLSLFDQDSAALVGVQDMRADGELRAPGHPAPTGAGVTIAVLDSGVDGTHPDLPYGTKVVGNVRIIGSVPTGFGFVPPAIVEGTQNTDPVLGHGTFVASVAAGSGAASGGVYAGIAPGANILGLSSGDLVLINVLEGFDYILDNANRFGVRVVNCSWGTQGWFDPDDPVNVATRALYDAGINVVFAAGNHGPSPDTLNPYAVAPWVIGVGSTRKDGTLSTYSSRGIYEELLYHPTLVAPGEGIIAAKAGIVGGADGTVGVVDPTGGYSVPPAYIARYTVESGTSFAAPHVAGAIALMLEAAPTLGPEEIRRVLQETATPSVLRDRSDIGAGRLDVWAAVARAMYPTRPFGTHIPLWMDQRPYRIEHLDPIESSYVLPAGGTFSLPVAVAAGTTVLDVDLAWGTAGDPVDLDVTVLDPAGREIARSASINGAGLFGRAEGVHLSRPPEGTLNVQVTAKATTVVDEPFYLHREASQADRVIYADLYSLPDADRATIERAIVANLIVGRGASFEPSSKLTRGEFARSLALTAGEPQRIPSTPTFADVALGNVAFPYVETVAGLKARSAVMSAEVAGLFDPDMPVTRLDLAVALVRAAGWEPEAIRAARTPPSVVDSGEIPRDLAGYVAIALNRGLLLAVPSPDGLRFEPSTGISRLEAAAILLRLRDVLAAGSNFDGLSPKPVRPGPPGGGRAGSDRGSKTSR
jgi:serine protease AprX